ncbi:hypothetical protein ABID58_006120 [Bradyrhizobium sp. S3.2.6]|uniref:hypothetical protein n=1 Tax=Bradyrhizobium sp. S3.2.6 TaxID=3156428 RepID=UPI00339A5D82
MEVRAMKDTTGFDYERTDINATGIGRIALGLGLFVIATPLLMPLVFPQAMSHRTPSAPPALSADAPQLEITPRRDLQHLRRGDDELAQSYGWTDRGRGVVRIPVARAMELLARKGLPAWPSP